MDLSSSCLVHLSVVQFICLLNQGVYKGDRTGRRHEHKLVGGGSGWCARDTLCCCVCQVSSQHFTIYIKYIQNCAHGISGYWMVFTSMILSTMLSSVNSPATMSRMRRSASVLGAPISRMEPTECERWTRSLAAAAAAPSADGTTNWSAVIAVGVKDSNTSSRTGVWLAKSSAKSRQETLSFSLTHQCEQICSIVARFRGHTVNISRMSVDAREGLRGS